MNNKSTYLVIDAGNTRIKVAQFAADDLLQLRQVNTDDWAGLEAVSQELERDACIISSVLDAEATARLQKVFPGSVLMQDCQLPIANAYHTPQTLGADRMANAVAAYHLAGKQAALAIDLGTCLKFDLVDNNGTYQGGSIAPGIRLRYEALHRFTAALPLLDDASPAPLIGSSTYGSIHSGVINGLRAEMQGLIQLYETQFPGLTIFMTGGDAPHFDMSAKKNIFADENLTLRGLLLILKANAH